MKRGEIWLVDFDPASGHEQQGKKPVMVISPKAFNDVTRTPVILPITTRSKFARTAGFAVPLDDCGTQTKGVVRCDQPRAVDIEFRQGRFLEAAPENVVDEVLAKVGTIFGL